MAEIVNPTGMELREDVQTSIPSMEIPSFRTMIANQRGTLKKILVNVRGGLGDAACAEPSLRFALDTFKDSEVSVATLCPELFEHLKFKKVYDLREQKPKWERYNVLHSFFANDTLSGEFLNHAIIHPVDYTSLCLMKSQLPVSYRAISFPVSKLDSDAIDESFGRFNSVVVHPGRTWQSRTLPADFWDAVIAEIKRLGAVPVLIGGAPSGGDKGTLAVDTSGCVDLRNRLSVARSVAVLQRAKAFLTNDSAPLHLAATGNSWIGFVATVKHPDFLKHWRVRPDGEIEFGWRMRNFSRGGAWEILNLCPNNPEQIRLDEVQEHVLRAWLPDPKEFANAAVEALCLT